jgi:ribosome silencing factor RsfS/YbeB/iojap
MKKDFTVSRETLAARLGEKRAEHVAGVADMASALAKRYGADAGKAEKAALLHDLFRNSSAGELDALIGRYGLDPSLKGDAGLSHGPVAAAFAREEMGVTDGDILNAVRYHTVGRAGMSTLEKLLYVADAAEPSRDYAGVSELRGIAWEDLDGACLMALENTLRYLRGNGKTPDPASVRALDWFKKRIGERGYYLESKELALKAAGVLRQKKGNDIVVLDIAEKSSFADFFVIASGNSTRQVGSLADDVEDAFAETDAVLGHIEGKPESGWVLLDYGDVIVNVFTREQRELYRIEQIWGDGERIDAQEE